MNLVRVVAWMIALAAAGSAAAQGKLPCESQPPGYDSHEIRCNLVASEATQRFRFKANFSGSHDDTTLSLTPTLDGAPLACDKGSKTDLMGEEGEVGLDCRFSIAGKPGTTQVLDVTLRWRHAQYKDFQLQPD